MIHTVADFSHWNSFTPVALVGQGVRAVFLKATQGVGFVDPEFVSRMNLARQAGLMVGAYHFADASDPIAQAAFFLSVAGSLSPGLALDLEPNGIGDTVTGAIAAMMVSQIQSATGSPPVIYTGRYGPSGTGVEYPNSVLSRCPLWLAEYGNPRAARLPRGWSTWTFWQNTDMPEDLDYFNGTSDQLSAFFAPVAP